MYKSNYSIFTTNINKFLIKTIEKLDKYYKTHVKHYGKLKHIQ